MNDCLWVVAVSNWRTRPTHHLPFYKISAASQSQLFNLSQQSRFSISDGLFRENAIGNSFWENGCIGRHLEPELADAVPLNLPDYE